MNYYTEAIKKYAVFNGRASRAEYWYFVLFNFIISFALILIEGSQEGTLYGIYSLFIILPGLAVGVRRMHDINKSGWFLVIPLYNLLLLTQKGDENVNKYGTVLQKDTIEAGNINESNRTKPIKYCASCGTTLESDSKFCIKCGSKIK